MFAPSDIAGLRGWWKVPDDAAGLYTDAAGTAPVTTDGDAVGYIADLSGLGHHATNATGGTTRPVWRDDVDGAGHGALYFDGVNDRLLLPGASIFNSAITRGTFFFRVMLPLQETEGHLVSGNQAGVNAKDWLVSVTATALRIYYNNADQIAPVLAGDVATWSTLILRFHPVSGLGIWLDGVPVGSDATVANFGGVAGDWYVGSSTIDTDYKRIWFKEMGVYDAVLTDPQMDDLATYLSDIAPKPIVATFAGRSDAHVYALQGVATDGTHFFTSSGTTADTHLYKWTKADDTYTLVTSRDTSPDWPAGVTQINHLLVQDGVIYAGANNYNDTPGRGWVFEFDADDLSFIAVHELSDDSDVSLSEGGDFGPDGNFYCVSHDRLLVYEFDPADWSFVAAHSLPTPPMLYSWHGWYNGGLWLTDDLFVANLHNPQNIAPVFRWTGSEFLLVNGIRPPTPQCGQGISLDPSDPTKMYWAERSYATNDHRVVETTLSGILPEDPLTTWESSDSAMVMG